MSLTHFDKQGRANMVDISAKPDSVRRAVATGSVTMSDDAFSLVKNGAAKKGDVIAVAELAGIMGAKKTPDLIPLCHPLALSGVKITIDIDDGLPGLAVSAEVKTTGKTGVEMEALTAVATACLTIYDMVKAADKSMIIGPIALAEKSGGKSGDFRNE